MSKFKNILTLALRPETGEGESIAALMAARRMVAAQGLDAMLGSDGKAKQHEAKYSLGYTIHARYQHGWLETILKQATRCGVEFELTEITTVDELLIGSLIIKFNVAGTKDATKEYLRRANREYDWIEKDIARRESEKKEYYSSNTKNPPPPPAPVSKPRPEDTKERTSWFGKIFG